MFKIFVHIVLEFEFSKGFDKITPPISCIEVTSGDKIIGAIFSVTAKFVPRILRWADTLNAKQSKMTIRDGEDSHAFLKIES